MISAKFLWWNVVLGGKQQIDAKKKSNFEIFGSLRYMKSVSLPLRKRMFVSFYFMVLCILLSLENSAWFVTGPVWPEPRAQDQGVGNLQSKNKKQTNKNKEKKNKEKKLIAFCFLIFADLGCAIFRPLYFDLVNYNRA